MRPFCVIPRNSRLILCFPSPQNLIQSKRLSIGIVTKKAFSSFRYPGWCIRGSASGGETYAFLSAFPLFVCSFLAKLPVAGLQLKLAHNPRRDRAVIRVPRSR